MIGIDIEKPKCCIDCPCYNAEFVCCNITGTKSWDLDCFEEVFEDCPLVDDVVPAKHGRWLDYPIAEECSQCSCCGVLRMGYSNYCPNCGADMREEGQDDERS